MRPWSSFLNPWWTILDLKTLTAEIVQTLARAVGTTVASLFLLDKEKDVHTCVSFYGWDGESPPEEQKRVQGLAALGESDNPWRRGV